MQSFWEQLYNAVIAKGRYLIYLEGLGNTITIALVACAIGLAIGTLIAIVKYYAAIRHGIGWRIGAAICDFYTTVIRGTPIILQLLIIYSITVWTKGTFACFVGFGINSGAYVSEIIRSGIKSVDIGQTEAGRSLGLSECKTMRLIVLPQAIKNILPALFNEFIALVKETSVAGYIAVRDMTMAANSIKTRVFNIVPLVVVAIVYLIIVIGLTQVQKSIERRLARSDRN